MKEKQITFGQMLCLKLLAMAHGKMNTDALVSLLADAEDKVGHKKMSGAYHQSDKEELTELAEEVYK